MLSFFPRDVLDEIWDLLSQFLRVFLPTFVPYVLKEQSELSTVNTLYNDIRCNSKIRYNVNLVCTKISVLKSNRPSVRPSVTNRVSAISHKLLKQI